jgi:hypothetical protein
MTSVVLNQSDEERVVSSLKPHNGSKIFDDMDFLPIRQSLYSNPANVPEYDCEVFHRIV